MRTASARLRGVRNGREIEIAARFVVDATGPRGFLHRALGLGERVLPGTPATAALYSHFSGVRRLKETGGIALQGEPPYPIDDAAVHHVFDGGWIWVLQFCNGVTSAGIAATDALAEDLGLAEGAAAWERVLLRIPVLREQFEDAKARAAFPAYSAAKISQRKDNRQELGFAAFRGRLCRSAVIHGVSADSARRITIGGDD